MFADVCCFGPQKLKVTPQGSSRRATTTAAFAEFGATTNRHRPRHRSQSDWEENQRSASETLSPGAPVICLCDEPELKDKRAQILQHCGDGTHVKILLEDTNVALVLNYKNVVDATSWKVKKAQDVVPSARSAVFGMTLRHAVSSKKNVAEVAQQAARKTISCTAQSLSTGFQTLHDFHNPASGRYVDPSRWCVTREHLRRFQEDVLELSKLSKIPKCGDYPDPYHDNPAIGPTIYQVNKHYIIPKTFLAGGMSWALMCHAEESDGDPKGIQCDVFATHAWHEGVFEFLAKVWSAWPHRAHGLYCCFLANPQCSDIAEVLTDNVADSPFAKALNKASCMIVVPNNKVSIYERLWCVYEAHLAIKAAKERNLIITLPANAALSKKMRHVSPGIISFVFGVLLGYLVLADVALPDGRPIGTLLGPGMWLLNCYTGFAFIKIALEKAGCDHDAVQETRWKVFFEYFSLLVIGVVAGFSTWQLLLHPGGFRQHGQRHRYEPGEDIACWLLMGSLVGVCIHDIVTLKIREVIDQEAGLLQFKTVRVAQCSVAEDRERIFKAICEDMDGSSEDDNINQIDNTITMLRSVGRYNRGVHINLLLGMSRSRARDAFHPFRIACGVCTFEFWWITDLRANGYDVTSFVMPIASLCILLGGSYAIGDVALFAVGIFFWSGIWFLITSNLPYFFTEQAVGSRQMSASTCWLQIVFLTLLVLGNAWHYSGIRHAARKRSGTLLEQPNSLVTPFLAIDSSEGHP